MRKYAECRGILQRLSRSLTGRAIFHEIVACTVFNVFALQFSRSDIGMINLQIVIPITPAFVFSPVNDRLARRKRGEL